jgi:hypothetical protein
MTMAFEEKNMHVADLSKENAALQGKIDILSVEKKSLLQSVRKMAAEYDALKGQVDSKVADAEARAQDKVRDFQVRLTAEQTLVQEKISQAKKPLEEQVASLKDQLEACPQAVKK